MKYGRLVTAATNASGGDPLVVVFVVAEGDPVKAISLVRGKAEIGAALEIVGRASHELLTALGLTPGEVRRV